MLAPGTPHHPWGFTDGINNIDMFTLGFQPAGNSNFLEGNLDEVTIYNYALSASEIMAIFNTGSAGKCKDVTPNQPPEADAGDDQPANRWELVTLDGSRSSDPEFDYPLSFSWQLVEIPDGSQVTLLDADTEKPSFTPDLPGNYIAELVVTDTWGLESEADQVLVSTINIPPIADAGPDQSIIEINTIVQLGDHPGRQSYDDDGDDITYFWEIIQKPEGSLAELSNPTSMTPTFVADVHGYVDYVVKLTVSDPWDDSAPDEVTISFDNVKPVADAGDNQSVEVYETVYVDGIESSDDNLDPLTYLWSIMTQPGGAVIEDPTAVQTSFVPDAPGQYVVSLVVNDGFVDSDPRNITVVAVSYEDSTVKMLKEVQDTFNEIPKEIFKNKNMRNAVTNKLNAVIDMVDQGLYEESYDKLQNDILKRTNGCADTGAPDKNDWIEDCEEQATVYPLIIETLALLEELI
jgi:hypothetical protein